VFRDAAASSSRPTTRRSTPRPGFRAPSFRTTTRTRSTGRCAACMRSGASARQLIRAVEGEMFDVASTSVGARRRSAVVRHHLSGDNFRQIYVRRVRARLLRVVQPRARRIQVHGPLRPRLRAGRRLGRSRDRHPLAARKPELFGQGRRAAPAGHPRRLPPTSPCPRRLMGTLIVTGGAASSAAISSAWRFEATGDRVVVVDSSRTRQPREPGGRGPEPRYAFVRATSRP